MSDGAPSTPTAIAAVREMIVGLRQELALLAACGTPGVATCLASARVAEASLGIQAGADAAVMVAALEQPGTEAIFITALRNGQPFAAIGMSPVEAELAARSISEILSRRAAQRKR